MNCYVCKFKGSEKKFGALEDRGGGSHLGSLIGRMPQEHVGAVKVFVCPHCGALHSDMRGHILNKDRTP